MTWRCAGGAGACSVHGGTPVVDWAPCKPGACANASTMVAPVPATLKGRTLRHLYVNGNRASRTRSN